MTINGYTSRNIPSPQVFSDVLETRMRAKASGDKETNLALKLVVNTTYGACLNKYNNLYDPLMGRSVCISGQLYLLELAMHCYQTIPDLKIVQLNTDGIMIEFDDAYEIKVQEIVDEWQSRTGFELEEDKIVKICQKDVNNYLEVQPSGKAKAKGGYLVKGIAPAGAFNINNSCCIVAKALKEYFVNGTPVEETINACDDIFQFQIIAKAGAKYKEAYHIVNGERQPVQKVNRIYATSNPNYGKLFKVKAENDSTAKINSLPEHCIIDNDNHLSISDVDKSFYIEMARKRVNDFKGIKPEKTRRSTRMAETANNNLYKRLTIVRKKFMEHGIQKTGKNGQLKSMYFQLNDIIPVSAPLFAEQDILPVMNFDKDTCSLTLIDMNDSNNRLVFCAPMREWNGNAAVTPVQALGATITYMRRYLYQVALDIVEVDEMEQFINPIPVVAKKEDDVPVTKPVSIVSKAPVTQTQRAEAVKQLTSTDGGATELQIQSLKNALKKLIEVDQSKEEQVQRIAMTTKGFTEITKAECENLLTKVGEMIAEATKQ